MPNSTDVSAASTGAADRTEKRLADRIERARRHVLASDKEAARLFGSRLGVVWATRHDAGDDSTSWGYLATRELTFEKYDSTSVRR